jgi:hypothetical protein
MGIPAAPRHLRLRICVATPLRRGGIKHFTHVIAVHGPILHSGALFAPVWGNLADRTRAYRMFFFAAFIILAVGFIGFSILTGTAAWLLSAFLIGFGTGSSNTVATLFVVEFTAQAEWSARISWLQTFNASGSVLGMAAAGFLAPRTGIGGGGGTALLTVRASPEAGLRADRGGSVEIRSGRGRKGR